MGRFVRHQACEKCGSKDNAAVYDDGGVYCFGCRESIVNSNGSSSSTSKSKKDYRLPPLELAPLHDRCIHEVHTKLYGVGVDEDYKAVYFPYYLDGKCVGAKKRMIDNWEQKDYRWEGDGSIGLFGMQTRNKRANNLIIVEGELDALAAHQMYSFGFTSVSLAHGAGGAVNDLKKHLEWIHSFDQVYLCFDMDVPGRLAVEQCKEVIKPGKCRVVLLPSEFKDANDMLKANEPALFRQCVDSAQMVLPKDYVLEDGEIVEMVKQDIHDVKQGSLYPTQFPSLNKAIGGLNPGELLTLCAHTGVGKTTLGLNLVLNAINQGRKVFLITLETRPSQIVLQLLEMQTGIRFYSSQEGVNVPESEYIEQLKYIAAHVAVYAGMGAMTHEKLENLIEYGALAGSHDMVFLDHITAATQSVSNNMVSAIDNTMSMLNRLTTQYKLTTIVISHLSRNSSDSARKNITLNSLRNSEGIAQYSHCVIGMVRDTESEDGVVDVRILKGHRRFGVGTPFQLVFNKTTRQYEELIDGHTSTQDSGSLSRKSFAETLKIRQQEKEEQRREDKLQESVRSEDTRTEPESNVRADAPEVREDLQAGLHDSNKDGEKDIHRGEGIFKERRPLKTISGKEIEPPPSLKDIILARRARDKAYFEDPYLRKITAVLQAGGWWWNPDLRGVGEP